MIKQAEFDKYSQYIDTQIKRSIKTRKNTQKRKSSFVSIAKTLKIQFPNYKSVLCIGCRDKSEIEAFTEQGFEATGIDLTNLDGIIDCDMSKIYKHPFFKNKEIDIIFCSHSLEHCLDFEGFIKSISYLNAKVIYVECPLRKNYSAWDCSLYDFMIPRDKVDPNTILKYFEGFKIFNASIYKSSRKNMSSIKFTLIKL